MVIKYGHDNVPLAVLIAAHSKLLGASLHAAAHHQPITRLKDVQRAGHAGVRHGAHKYGNVLCKTVNQRTGGRREGEGETGETDDDIESQKDMQQIVSKERLI